MYERVLESTTTTPYHLLVVLFIVIKVVRQRINETDEIRHAIGPKRESSYLHMEAVKLVNRSSTFELTIQQSLNTKLFNGLDTS